MLERDEKYLKNLEKKVKELKALVIQDPLTKILNRRGLNERLDVFDSMYDRYDMDYLVAFFDINNFKKINTHQGHIGGDIILKKIAKTAKRNIRKSDVVARVGGDEFIILLCSPTEKDFTDVCKKLFRLIEDECNLGITYSCAKRSDHDSIVNLLKQLDEYFCLQKQ